MRLPFTTAQLQNVLFWGFIACVALSVLNPFHLRTRTRRIMFWAGIAMLAVDLLMQLAGLG
jgi:hypothetical protein